MIRPARGRHGILGGARMVEVSSIYFIIFSPPSPRCSFSTSLISSCWPLRLDDIHCGSLKTSSLWPVRLHHIRCDKTDTSRHCFLSTAHLPDRTSHKSQQTLIQAAEHAANGIPLCLTSPGPAECAKRLNNNDNNDDNSPGQRPIGVVRSPVTPAAVLLLFPDRAKWAPLGPRRAK